MFKSSVDSDDKGTLLKVCRGTEPLATYEPVQEGRTSRLRESSLERTTSFYAKTLFRDSPRIFIIRP